MKLAMLLASIIPLLFVATNVEAHYGYKDKPGNLPKPVGADDPIQMPGPIDSDFNHVHPEDKPGNKPDSKELPGPDPRSSGVGPVYITIREA